MDIFADMTSAAFVSASWHRKAPFPAFVKAAGRRLIINSIMILKNNRVHLTQLDAVRGAVEERSKLYFDSTVSSTAGGNEEMRRLCKM